MRGRESAIEWLARPLLQDSLADLGNWYLVILGAVAIGITLVAPQGLWGFLRGRLSVFPIGYHATHQPPHFT